MQYACIGLRRVHQEQKGQRKGSAHGLGCGPGDGAADDVLDNHVTRAGVPEGWGNIVRSEGTGEQVHYKDKQEPKYYGEP